MPRDDDGPWAWLLFRQSGVVTYAQALEHFSPSHIRHEISRGRWRRVSHGVILTGGELGRKQQLWVAVLAAGEGAFLAGFEAAREAGLRLGSRRLTIDVIVPASRRRRKLPKLFTYQMPGLKVHRSTVAIQAAAGDPPRTVIARSLVDAAQWCQTDREAQLIVATACQQRLVSPEEILAEADGQPRAKRRAMILCTTRDIQGGATALSEIDFVRLCRKHGLPPPDLQERRKDASGRTRFLDAYWKKAKLHVEVDGSHHIEARHWSADMLRQNEVWLKGDRVLRFPAFLLRTDPGKVVEQIRKALGSP
jgi:very-short-patch-repair endonuclease